jgi:hypothetical protein
MRIVFNLALVGRSAKITDNYYPSIRASNQMSNFFDSFAERIDVRAAPENVVGKARERFHPSTATCRPPVEARNVRKAKTIECCHGVYSVVVPDRSRVGSKVFSELNINVYRST